MESTNAVGWDAISAACERLYPGQEPRHFGTLISYRLGGPDPLQGISAWKQQEPQPHWHFVTYGFSELYEKESEDAAVSGYGFELTFRLAIHDDADQPPRWALNFLQNLARYVFQTGNVFRAGDWMSANGPIATEQDTRIVSLAFANDPELPAIDTPNGSVAFLQVVGLTIEEEAAAKRWKTSHLLDVLQPAMPLWITDLSRTTLVTQEPFKTRIEEGTQRDGSSTGFLWTDVLDWQQAKRLLRDPMTTIGIGALSVRELAALLPLRLPYGRPLRVVGESAQVVFVPASSNAIKVDGSSLELHLTDASARECAALLDVRRGTYRPISVDTLAFEVRPTDITDAQGHIVETIG